MPGASVGEAGLIGRWLAGVIERMTFWIRLYRLCRWFGTFDLGGWVRRLESEIVPRATDNGRSSAQE